MYDRQALLSKFKLIAQQEIGAYLSKTSSNVPEVHVERFTGSKPPYPYVVVDMFELSPQSLLGSNRFINEDDEEVVQIYKRFMVSYRMYGGSNKSVNSKNANWVINQLQNKFYLSRIINDLETELGIAIHNISGIDDLPVRLADKYLESASFNMTIHVVDSVSDTDAFLIETVDLDLKTYPSREDEERYIEQQIIVTTP